MNFDGDTDGEDDMRLFAGPNAQDFLALKSGSSSGARPRAKIFWPGFLAPMIWFLYRKMYLTAAAIAIGPMAFALVIHSDFLSKAIGFGLAAVGGMGPRIYVAQAASTIARIRASARDEDEARALIVRAGGVSLSGAVIGGVIMLSMVALAVAAKSIKS
jgi:hypothetical protein